MIIGSGADLGKVTTSNPAAGSGSSHTAADVAALILDDPNNLLVTNASGQVEASNMRGTDGANTVAPDNTSITAILADTNELQLNQGNWLTATGFSTHSAADVATAVLVTPANKLATDASGNVEANNMRGTDLALLAADAPTRFSDLIIGSGADLGKVTTSNPAAGSGSSHTAADVAALILDNPSNLLVTNASGQVESSNMRGTDGANTVAPDNTSITAILADTNELQLNQGDWATATGFSTHSAADVATAVLVTPANKLATDASGNVEANNMRGTDGANTVAPDNTSITAILADTNELQQNQGDWATATGFSTHSASDVASLILVTPLNKLATDASGNVEASNMRGTDFALLAADAPTNWSTLIIGTGADAGKVTTSNPAAGSGSAHTANDVVVAMQAVADDFKADVTDVIRKGVSLRYTNDATGVGFDEVTITDAP